MEAKELRLGNLVTVDKEVDSERTNKERVIGLWDFSTYLQTSSHYYKPIPLTEEWLVKFGFEEYKTDKSDVYRLNGFLITYVFNGMFKGKRYLKFHNITFEDFGHVQFVHTLQNLYFALTNKELEIK